MKKITLLLLTIICGTAHAFEHEFSRGMDVYYIGEGQDKLVISCDQDTTERQGSVLMIGGFPTEDVPYRGVEHGTVEFENGQVFEVELDQPVVKLMNENAYDAFKATWANANSLQYNGSFTASFDISENKPNFCITEDKFVSFNANKETTVAVASNDALPVSGNDELHTVYLTSGEFTCKDTVIFETKVELQDDEFLFYSSHLRPESQRRNGGQFKVSNEVLQEGVVLGLGNLQAEIAIKKTVTGFEIIPVRPHNSEKIEDCETIELSETTSPKERYDAVLEVIENPIDNVQAYLDAIAQSNSLPSIEILESLDRAEYGQRLKEARGNVDQTLLAQSDEIIGTEKGDVLIGELIKNRDLFEGIRTNSMFDELTYKHVIHNSLSSVLNKVSNDEICIRARAYLDGFNPTPYLELGMVFEKPAFLWDKAFAETAINSLNSCEGGDKYAKKIIDNWPAIEEGVKYAEQIRSAAAELAQQPIEIESVKESELIKLAQNTNSRIGVGRDEIQAIANYELNNTNPEFFNELGIAATSDLSKDATLDDYSVHCRKTLWSSSRRDEGSLLNSFINACEIGVIERIKTTTNDELEFLSKSVSEQKPEDLTDGLITLKALTPDLSKVNLLNQKTEIGKAWTERSDERNALLNTAELQEKRTEVMDYVDVELDKEIATLKPKTESIEHLKNICEDRFLQQNFKQKANECIQALNVAIKTQGEQDCTDAWDEQGVSKKLSESKLSLGEVGLLLGREQIGLKEYFCETQRSNAPIRFETSGGLFSKSYQIIRENDKGLRFVAELVEGASGSEYDMKFIEQTPPSKKLDLNSPSSEVVYCVFDFPSCNRGGLF